MSGADFNAWLRERLLKALDRYDRDPRYVAVHELLRSVYELPQLRKRMEPDEERVGYLVVGDVFERGLMDALGARPAPRIVKTVAVEAELSRSVATILDEAGVDYVVDDGMVELTVTGSTDLFVEDDPDGARLWEVKTTRSRTWRTYMDRWVAQAAAYADLYWAPVRLVVFNVASGRLEPATRVFKPSGALYAIIRRWLSGDPFPYTGVVVR